LPEGKSRVEPIRQAEHARAQFAHQIQRQRRLGDVVASQAHGEKGVRAVFTKADKAQLGKGGLAPTRILAAEMGEVLLGVGHIQSAAVDGKEPPPTIKGAGLTFLCHGHGALLPERFERGRAQAAARLGDGRLARHVELSGSAAPEPLESLDQAAQDLAGGHRHEQAQGDDIVNKRLGGQIPDPLALQAHPLKEVANPLARITSGQNSDAQMLGDPAPGAHRHCGACHGGTHSGARHQTRQHLSEQYWG